MQVDPTVQFHHVTSVRLKSRLHWSLAKQEMISGRFVGVRVQQGGFISKKESQTQNLLLDRCEPGAEHSLSSINPLAAVPAKPNECQGSDGRQNRSREASFDRRPSDLRSP